MSFLNKSITSVAIATIALLGTSIVASEKSLAANLKTTEPSLDAIINDSYSIFSAETFEVPSGNITFELLAEFAGNANKNAFGIYDVKNTANRLNIFSGSAKAKDPAIDLKVAGNTLSTNQGSITLQGNTFGFYIDVPGTPIYYSDSTLNPNKSQQAKTFRNGTDGIVAFEDKSLWMSDGDYNDMVILASGLWNPEVSSEIAEIPEPSTVLGLTLLVGSLAASRRRQIKDEA